MQLYLVEFVPLRLRFLIAIGDVPLEAVTATSEAVDALIKNNAEDQEFVALRNSGCHLLMPRTGKREWGDQIPRQS